MYWWWHGSVNFRIRIECNIYSCVVYLHFHRAIHVFFQFFLFFEHALTFSRSDFNRIGGENEDTNDWIVFMFPLFIDISLWCVIYLSLVGNSQKHISISILFLCNSNDRNRFICISVVFTRYIIRLMTICYGIQTYIHNAAIYIILAQLLAVKNPYETYEEYKYKKRKKRGSAKSRANP